MASRRPIGTRSLRAALVFALTLSSATALAESAAPSCLPGNFSPNMPEIPANLTAFRMSGGLTPFDMTPFVRLYQIVGAGRAEVPVTVLEAGSYQAWTIRLDAALVEGERYELVDESCGPGYGSLRFTSIAPAPPPMELGVTTVSELRSYRPSPGGPLETYVRVTLELTPEARTARLLHEGQWFTEEASGTWSVLDDYDQHVSVNCERSYVTAVAPGTQTFAHQARRGALPVLATEGVTVTLRCEDAVRVDPTTERALTPAEIEEMDRIPPGPPIDGGAWGSPGGSDAGPNGTLATYGCSCRVDGRGATPRAVWLLLSIGALGLYRRRTRARRAVLAGHRDRSAGATRTR